MKIFDCFKFFNELELLELRLMELYDFVDYFVIVEANKTHTGIEKEFIFEKNKQYFSQYLDKIIHVKVEDLPKYSKNDMSKKDGGIWDTENFQRNCIMRGLYNKANIGDKIIVSDLDEIPNVETIKKYLNDRNWITFTQDLFYYYVNCKQNESWNGPIMAPYGTFQTPQQLRDAARFGFNAKPNGGWHYSFMGGADRIKTKVESIAESHLIIDKVGDINEIEKKMNLQVDLWGRTQYSSMKQIVDISNNKPKKMDKFLEKYPNFFYKQL